MPIVHLELIERGGKWCVKIDDKRRILHLGTSDTREGIKSYAEWIAAALIAGGDQPIIVDDTERREAAARKLADGHDRYIM